MWGCAAIAFTTNHISEQWEAETLGTGENLLGLAIEQLVKQYMPRGVGVEIIGGQGMLGVYWLYRISTRIKVFYAVSSWSRRRQNF